jgi:hypothetical protein
MSRLILFALAAFISGGCSGADDSLASVDAQYRVVSMALGTANRDTARNVKNKEARRRKVNAERDKLAFFHDPKVKAAIEAARQAEVGTTRRAKADAYWRAMVVEDAWTPEEKATEAKLLAKLEAMDTVEATWTSEDGSHEIDISRGWGSVGRKVADLTQDERQSVAAEWANHQMRVVSDTLQELVRTRNAVARRAGFADYYELALAGHGLSVEDVDAIVADLSALVAPFNASLQEQMAAAASSQGIENSFENTYLVRKAAGLESSLGDIDKYFDADLAEERIRTAFADMGLSSEGWQVYAGPRRYFRPGAYTFPIRPPGAVAIVMSKDSRWSRWNYEALAHEGGLANWWSLLDEDAAASPALWEPPAPWFEGFGQFFERLLYEKEFAERYLPKLPEQVRESLAKRRRQGMVSRITHGIVQTLAERRLYRDPTSLAAVTRHAAETRHQLTGRPMAPVTEDGLHYDSALLSTILWNYPAYSQNFLFSYVVGAWLYEAVVAKIGQPVANPETATTLATYLVRVPPEVSFPRRLEAMLPGVERVEPLKRYLEINAAPTAD